jgi:hypothetical protein
LSFVGCASAHAVFLELGRLVHGHYFASPK